MRTLTKTTTKFTCITFTVLLLFLGCKKDELTASQWGERAVAKQNEMLKLASNIPCSQKLNVSIQSIENSCSTQYFAILASDLAKYEKLKKEYLEALDKQYKAWTQEGIIVDFCSESIWARAQPMRLDCKDDKIQLITSANLPLAEAKSLIVTTKLLIDQLLNAQTCNSDASWAITPIIDYQTMKIEYIPYLSSGNYKELKEKVSLYNRLNFNVIEAEKKDSNYIHGKQIDKVECLNGKPVIKYKN